MTDTNISSNPRFTSPSFAGQFIFSKCLHGYDYSDSTLSSSFKPFGSRVARSLRAHIPQTANIRNCGSSGPFTMLTATLINVYNTILSATWPSNNPSSNSTILHVSLSLSTPRKSQLTAPSSMTSPPPKASDPSPQSTTIYHFLPTAY